MIKGPLELKRSSIMTNAVIHKSLIEKVELYVEMMFASDVGRFDQVFAATAHLHGPRGAVIGGINCWKGYTTCVTRRSR